MRRPGQQGPNLFSLKEAGTLNNAIPASVANSHQPPVKYSQSKHSEGLRDKEVSSSASEAKRPHSFQEHPAFKRNEIKRAQQRHLWTVPSFPVSKNSVPIILSAVSVESSVVKKFSFTLQGKRAFATFMSPCLCGQRVLSSNYPLRPWKWIKLSLTSF